MTSAHLSLLNKPFDDSVDVKPGPESVTARHQATSLATAGRAEREDLTEKKREKKSVCGGGGGGDTGGGTG